jgi:acyl transferase domain-containing protein
MSDIAIIGYALKLPQDVNDDESFWDVLQNRRNLMTEWPEDRVKTESFANNKHQKVGSQKPISSSISNVSSGMELEDISSRTMWLLSMPPSSR